MSTEPLRTYVVECYRPRRDAARLAADAARARRAAAALSRRGRPVRHVRVLYLAEEETCFHLYEAVSAEAVAEACRGASLASARIVAAQVVDPAPSAGAGAPVSNGLETRATVRPLDLKEQP